MNKNNIDIDKERPESVDTLDQLVILIDFLKILPRLWVWFLILVILGGSISYYKASSEYYPVYKASSTFTITIKREQSIMGSVAFYDNAAAEQMAKTFPYILTSSLLHRKVAAHMESPVTSSIDVHVTPNTNLLTLTVTDKDPQKAYDTLNAVILNYPDVSEPIVGKVTMKVLDESGLPTSPANPKVFIKDTLIGAGIGFALGLVWAILVFLTNRTIQKESDIKKKLGIKCLGIIPRIAKKKRSKEVSRYFVLTDPKAKDFLQESFRMVRNKVEYHAHKYKHKTILVTSAAAGEGKSFFAANLALSLVTTGKKVVLIDCDLRHPTGRLIFQMEQSTGLGEYLKGETDLETYLQNAKAQNIHEFPNFLFLPGGAPVPDGSHLLSSTRMQNLIECVKAKTDYVILDCAPAGLLTDPAVLAKYAESALLVIRKDFARVDFISEALAHLSESNIHIIGGVLNDVQV
ncbi:MAG: polysaccharide biosynthesis tyrosine autokinase [Ruminococcus sp.]|nr:polysaccharide biosynthesis tyrosine autokinase [Ruminococcus sp.]